MSIATLGLPVRGFCMLIVAIVAKILLCKIPLAHKTPNSNSIFWEGRWFADGLSLLKSI